MSERLCGLAALRRFLEQRGQVEVPAEPVQVENDGEERIVPEDDDGDEFDALHEAWVDFNMEVGG